MSGPSKLLPISLLLLCTSAGAIEPLTVQANKTKTIDLPDELLEYSSILVNQGGNLTVNANGIGVIGDSSCGIKSYVGSKLSLNATNSIVIGTKVNSHTYGIQARDKIDLVSKEISIKTEVVDPPASGIWSVGIYSLAGAKITANASDELNISASAHSEDESKSFYVYGIYGYSDNNENSVSLEGDKVVINSSSDNKGNVIGIYSTHNNSTVIKGHKSVSITANNTHQNNDKQVYGIWVGNNAKEEDLKKTKGGNVYIEAPKVEINTTGTGDVRGIHVAHNTQESDYFSILKIQSDEININSTNLGTSPSIGASVFSDGRMYLDGNTTISADEAIVARGYTKTQINRGISSKENYTRITGDINFSYDRKTSPDDVNADVSVLFYSKNSYWKGSPKVSWTVEKPEEKPDEKKLTLTGLDLTFNSCAVWMPEKVETFFRELSGQYEIPVNTLELNNGVIRFDSPDIVAAAETVKGSRAIVHTPVLLEGNSVQSSHFVYENTSGNTPEFKVIFSGITADQLTDNVRNELSRAVLKGTVDFKNETNPVISADAIPAPQKQAVPEGLISGAQIWEVGPDGKVKNDSIVEAENTVNSALFDVAVSNYLFYRSQMNDGVASRMGDLRSAPKENGAWVRVFGGENKYSGRDMKLKYTDLEIGADHFFDEKYYLGGLFTYSKGDGRLSNGSTDHKNYSFGLYGGWLGDNGMYADFVVRYLRLDTDFNILRKPGSVIDAFNDCANCRPSMFPGEANSGSYKNNAYSASVEIGRRMFNSARSFYVEPQTELRFGRIKSSSYHTNRGVLVKQDKTDSVVGRIGVAVGKVFNENKGNAYFNVSVLHDWKGKIKQTYSKDGVSRTYRDDVGGTWGEFTLGSTYKPSENVSVYGSVKTSVGSPIRNPWQVNIGMRYNF